jgi:hypothetical protein
MKFTKRFFWEIEKEIFVIILLALFGMTIFSHLEGWRYLDALYFTVTTMAAVGLGDFVPKTDAGKVVTIFYSLTGVPLMAYAASIFVKETVVDKR